MKEIRYTITDPLGLHARPAGLLVKEASRHPCAVKISVNGGAAVDAKRILGVMKLAAKQGMELTLTFDGADEEAAAASVADFLRATL